MQRLSCLPISILFAEAFLAQQTAVWGRRGAVSGNDSTESKGLEEAMLMISSLWHLLRSCILYIEVGGGILDKCWYFFYSDQKHSFCVTSKAGGDVLDVQCHPRNMVRTSLTSSKLLILTCLCWKLEGSPPFPETSERHQLWFCSGQEALTSLVCSDNIWPGCWDCFAPKVFGWERWILLPTLILRFPVQPNQTSMRMDCCEMSKILSPPCK